MDGCHFDYKQKFPLKEQHGYELPVLGFRQTDTFPGSFGGHLIFMSIASRKKEAYCPTSKKENVVKGLPRPGP
jgi:hypothetical protein